MAVKEEVVGLTSLRGIAAIAVVLQHFSSTVQRVCTENVPSWVPHGYVAVDLFFVLSGYVMCYVYLDSFKQQGTAAYLPFLKRRAVRLLPLNFIVVAFLILAAYLSIALLGRNIFFPHQNTWLDIVSNLLMLQGLGIGENMNGPAWSVSVEILAYALFPLLIACASGGPVLAAVSAVIALAGLAAVAAQSPRLGLTLADPLNGSLRCVCQFTLGMLTYRLSFIPNVAVVMSSTWAARLGVALVAALLLLRIDLLTALSFPALILVCALNQTGLKRVLAWRPLHLLGVISYALYLIHEPFRSLLLLAIRQAGLAPLSVPVAMAVALLASMAMIPLAILVHRHIELPLGRIARGWLFRAPGRAAAA